MSKVVIHKGKGGWGGPLVVEKTDEKKYVISVTGGGIHPVAEKIAELTGGIAVDSFKNPVEANETIAAVIDCGGTARSGTYPRMRIPTINVKVGSPSGPLAKFMTDDIFISGVTVDDVSISNEVMEDTESIVKEEVETTEFNQEKIMSEDSKQEKESNVTPQSNGFIKLIDSIGRGAGNFMNIMYQAGRETIDTVMTNILPFMAFVATLIGIINYTGVGSIIAKVLSPLAGSLLGLVVLGFITSLPFLSPILAPGAIIAAIIGILIGDQIALGTIPAHYALPALFAINSQVGCDFAPVGMTLGEAKPETISIGVPAVLFSRVITGPIAVIVAYLLSFGL